MKIKLKNGVEVELAMPAFPKKCKSCGTPIVFGITKNNNVMPLVLIEGSWCSHFADCPDANKFRKKK